MESTSSNMGRAIIPDDLIISMSWRKNTLLSSSQRSCPIFVPALVYFYSVVVCSPARHNAGTVPEHVTQGGLYTS